jgi:hypothetical protein
MLLVVVRLALLDLQELRLVVLLDLLLVSWLHPLLLARWVDYGGNHTYPLRLDQTLLRE